MHAGYRAHNQDLNSTHHAGRTVHFKFIHHSDIWFAICRKTDAHCALADLLYHSTANGSTLSAAAVDGHFETDDILFLAQGDVPPQSLDPLDYSIWTVLQEEVQGEFHANLEVLKAYIVKPWK